LDEREGKGVGAGTVAAGNHALILGLKLSEALACPLAAGEYTRSIDATVDYRSVYAGERTHAALKFTDATDDSTE
jgi:hypothetical protein